MLQYLIYNILYVTLIILYGSIDKRVVRKQRKYIYAFFLIGFAYLMAIRPTETPDTQIYINAFTNVNSGWLKNVSLLQKYNSAFEYGYIFLMLLARRITSNARVFLFFICLAGMLLTARAFKKLMDRVEGVDESGTYFDALSTTIVCYGLLYFGISVRAGLAIGLGLTFINCMLDKKWLRSVLLLAVAFSIQRTAILYILIYLAIRFLPVLKKKMHYVIWALAGILLFSNVGRMIYRFIGPTLIQLMNTRNISSYGYLSEALSNTAAVARTDILTWLIYGILIFFSIEEEHYNKYLNSIMIGAMILSIFNDVMAISRAYDLFYMFTVPMYCILNTHDSAIIKDQRHKKLLIHALMIMNFYIMLELCILKVM